MRSLAIFIVALLFLSPSWVNANEHCAADLDGDGQVARRHNHHHIQHAVLAFFLDHIRQHGSPMG